MGGAVGSSPFTPPPPHPAHPPAPTQPPRRLPWLCTWPATTNPHSASFGMGGRNKCDPLLRHEPSNPCPALLCMLCSRCWALRPLPLAGVARSSAVAPHALADVFSPPISFFPLKVLLGNKLRVRCCLLLVGGWPWLVDVVVDPRRISPHATPLPTLLAKDARSAVAGCPGSPNRFFFFFLGVSSPSVGCFLVRFYAQ